ncbi:MAG TPA: DUF1844 domain-containing protein [bacterium]|nr:DUF1844 domain-containing protein [bacterium]
MPSKEEEENQGFKVNDRRRFQADGTPAEEKPSPEAAESRSEPDQPEPADEAARAAPEKEIPADFVTLLLSLAASAQSALGISPNPRNGKLELRLPEAKYSIDLLAMLQEKTQGNLSSEEEKFLQALLYDLRLRYVEAKGGS